MTSGTTCTAERRWWAIVKKVTLKAPLDTINVHIRGGSILPLLPPTVRTDVSRSQNYTVVVVPGSDGKAAGQLFWDDGENRDSVTAGEFSLVDFTLDGNTLSSVTTKSVYVPGIGLPWIRWCSSGSRSFRPGLL